MFNIRDFVEFDKSGRAVCPSCELEGKTRNKNLSLVPGTEGAYKCHRGCTPQQIREVLGQAKPRTIPTALARSKPNAKVTVSPQSIKEAHHKLIEQSSLALAWLTARGFTQPMIEHFQLGISRAKVGDRHLPAITIPIPANPDRTAFYQKKRVAPWLAESDRPAEYAPWSQYGIPPIAWLTHSPPAPKQTWLCEGEWDAMMLGWAVCHSDVKNDIQVGCFTCGCSAVPPAAELEQLQGNVVIFFDRNDVPLKNGTIPGDEGARKVALALGDRARIALVPMPADCAVAGWDVSDALNHGYQLADFTQAAAVAEPFKPQPKRENPLKSRMISTDELLARAPEYVEWLVPDLLTSNELFGLAAPPRGGKSLLCMLLAKCVATGEKLLDRPVSKGSVIYVNLEDSEAKIRERVEAQQWAEGLPIYWIDRFKLNEIDYLIEIADGIDDLRLIILDTLSRIRSDDKAESSAEMSFVLEPLQEFAKTRNVCILLVHHTTKLNVDKTTLDELFDTVRGSTSIRGTCRGLLVIAPGENCYRLAVENGWGKHDLKIRLDSTRLEWKLLGRWNPIVNLDQRETVLNYLNLVGSSTIDTIAQETGVPKRSLYTVLDRLIADELIVKTGTRKAAVYQRPIQPIQLLNCLLNSPNEDSVSDTGPIQQKNKIFSRGDHRKSDHPTDAKGFDSNNPVELAVELAEMPNNASFFENGSMSDTERSKPLSEAFSGADDHFSMITPPEKDAHFVELEGQIHTEQAFPNSTSNSTEFNKPFKSDHATQPNLLSANLKMLKKGRILEFNKDSEWVKVRFVRLHDRSRFSPLSRTLEAAVWIEEGEERQLVTVDRLRLPQRKGRNANG